eukprot:jgi/Astpho2/3733/Aster-04917
MNVIVTLLVLLLAQLTSTSGSATDDVATFVHVSDLHLSHHHQHWYQVAGDNEGDLKLLAERVLRPLQPGAVVFGGDLVDAKTLLMQGLQYEDEWQASHAYRRVLEHVTTVTGLPESRLLDVRGNHDTFNVPSRLGDFFTQYSAQGRRNGSAWVTATHLAPLHTPSTQAAGAHVVMRPAAGFHGLKLHVSAQPESTGDCPPAVLLGLDATQSPGLRGPTNFVGIADTSNMEELRGVLAEQADLHRQCRHPVPIVACGHHPLSTIWQKDLSLLQPLDLISPTTFQGLLSSAGVLAYLNGHLHGAFGKQLHRMHKAGPAGQVLGLKACSFRVQPGYLLELEAAAWKDQRRFRVAAVDQGRLAFADLHLVTPSRPSTQMGNLTAGQIGISGVHTEVKVSSHVVLLTSPTDARFSQLGAGSLRQQYPDIRALALPVELDGKQGPAVVKAWIQWQCQTGAQRGAKALTPADGSGRLFEAAWDPAISCGPAAQGGMQHISLQVHVLDAHGHESSSQTYQVTLLLEQGRSVPTDPAQPLPLQLSRLERFTLWNNWPRFLQLWVWWFVATMTTHLVLFLLLPRLLGPHLYPWLSRASHTAQLRPLPTEVGRLDRHSISSSPARNSRDSLYGQGLQNSKTHVNGQLPSPAQGRRSQQNGRTRRAQARPSGVRQAVIQQLLWVPRILCEMAQLPRLWWPQVRCFLHHTGRQVEAHVNLPHTSTTAPVKVESHWPVLSSVQVVYSIYLLIGPWFPARFLSEAPPGLYFALGALIRLPPTGQWQFVSTVDTLITGNLQTFFSLLPLTLWTAAVASR